MFTYRNLMRFVAAPVWRIIEEEFYPNTLEEQGEILHWTDRERRTLPAFFNHPFPIVNTEMLQFLLEHVGEQFEYRSIQIAGLPADQYYRLHFNDLSNQDEMITEIQGKKVWIDKGNGQFLISSALKKSFEETDLKGVSWEPTMAYKKEQSYYDYLFQQLKEAHGNNDLEALNAIVECARANGFFLFYNDFDERLTVFFNLLLQISIDLLDTPPAFVSDKLWFFITEVYDIKFHQIQLDEYPAETRRLYFELTQKVLQPSFHPLELDKDKKLHWYGRALYFIKMASHWFAGRPDEFFSLYTLILPLCYDPAYHLDAYWLEEYKDLTDLTES